MRNPRSWSRLRKWGTFRVPFIAPWTDGRPRFGKKDDGKLRRCFYQHRCNVCGQSLQGEQYVFAGGYLCTKARAFHEPPLHEECIRASFSACPYLFKLLTGEVTGGMYLTFARGVDMVRLVDGSLSFRPRTVVRVETIVDDPEASSVAALIS